MTILEKSIFHLKHCFFYIALAGGSDLTLAECSDFDAKLSADKAAQQFINGKAIANTVALQSAEIFKSALVLKKHLPSKRKEVASYVKTSDLYYTVYSLVNSECEAKAVKRTAGKY